MVTSSEDPEISSSWSTSGVRHVSDSDESSFSIGLSMPESVESAFWVEWWSLDLELFGRKSAQLSQHDRIFYHFFQNWKFRFPDCVGWKYSIIGRLNWAAPAGRAPAHLHLILFWILLDGTNYNTITQPLNNFRPLVYFWKKKFTEYSINES